MIIDLSLNNAELYAGCEIEEIAGRLNLVTPIQQAATIVGRNIHASLSNVPSEERNECVLTGAMAIWVYLVVFHAVVHAFRQVIYDDGRHERVVVARHG